MYSMPHLVASRRSTTYPVMGVPPSSSGSAHTSVSDVRSIFSGFRFTGGPGSSVYDSGINYIKDLDKRLSLQKGIKVEFETIQGANHFFSKSEAELTKCISEYIKKETALY